MKWQDFAPVSHTRIRESIEWSITYAYDTHDTDKPRVLLIGDSICNGYNGAVRDRLAGKVNVSFWASSKCVTDPDYFRELDFMLDARPYDIICFNNGLHSLNTNREEWDAAYASVVAFILAKLPCAKLSLTLSTPLKDAALTAISASLNETVQSIGVKRNLPIIDLFTAMNGLDRDEFWSDTYHFRSEAIAIQADLIADHILEQLGMN
ncbi:MAG: SGNH/GDSL hydrolase family protein [Clostridia bacterium]|nr:SGNH/GDSL hydrolase family protein [Clostridia bacterium]